MAWERSRKRSEVGNVIVNVIRNTENVQISPLAVLPLRQHRATPANSRELEQRKRRKFIALEEPSKTTKKSVENVYLTIKYVKVDCENEERMETTLVGFMTNT